jgi:hypothetical protein
MKAPWTKRHSIPASIVLLLSREPPRATRCKGIERSKDKRSGVNRVLLNHGGRKYRKQDKRIGTDSFSDQRQRGGIERSKIRKLARTDFCSATEVRNRER